MMVTCARCGWTWDQTVSIPTKIADWPSGLPEPPPLPKEANPHPRGNCPSPIVVGQEVFWDLGESVPDLPPVRAVFNRLDSFEGPAFILQDETWVKTSEAVGKAAIKIDKNSVHPGLLDHFPNLLNFDAHVVFLDDLTAVNKWPIIIPKE